MRRKERNAADETGVSIIQQGAVFVKPGRRQATVGPKIAAKRCVVGGKSERALFVRVAAVGLDAKPAKTAAELEKEKDGSEWTDRTAGACCSIILHEARALMRRP